MRVNGKTSLDWLLSQINNQVPCHSRAPVSGYSDITIIARQVVVKLPGWLFARTPPLCRRSLLTTGMPLVPEELHTRLAFSPSPASTDEHNAAVIRRCR